MNDALLLLSAAAVVAVTWGLVVFRLAGGGTTDAYGMCAPARYEPLTARPAEPPRRIVAELAPPAGWRDVAHVAIGPAPAPAQVDDWDDDEPLAVVVVPDLEPFAADDWGDEPWLVVEDWPKQQAAQTDPVPMIVNRTAARFASLEVRR